MILKDTIIWTFLVIGWLGTIAHIALIGKPRDPYSKTTAIANLIVTAITSLALIYLL